MSDETDTLATRVVDGPLPFVDVASVLDDVFEALAETHARGLVDRALTPDRIVVCRTEGVLRGRLRKHVGPGPSSASSEQEGPPSVRRSTVAFLAPEQVKGTSSLDGRTDIYALGAIAFFALTSKLPSCGRNALEVMRHKLECDPPTLQSVSGRLHGPLVELFVATAMATAPNRRYARIGVALAALREARAVFDLVRPT